MRSPLRTAARALLGPFVCLFVLSSLLGCSQVDARRRIQEGNKAYYAGKYEEAVTAYKRGLELNPSLDIGWYNLALAHLAMFSAGKDTPENKAHADGAIASFKRYLELKPADQDAMNFLLQTYIDSGQYQLALAHFEDVLAKSPKGSDEHSNALFYLAKINEDAGEYATSIKWHRQRAADEAKPEMIYDAWYRIGEMCFRRLNKKVNVIGAERVRIADEGIAALENATEVKTDDMKLKNALVMRNLLLRQRGMGQGLSYATLVEFAASDLGRQKVRILKEKMDLEKKAKDAADLEKNGTPTAPADEKKL